MKKIFLLMGVFALMMTMGLFTSCGDNKDVSSYHILSDAELDELARQDSIKKAQKNRIDADLLLQYTVEDYASASTWTSKNVEIDLDAIGKLFGLTADEVKAGINKEDGAPEITGFAIKNSDHADYSTASTTNGSWGHWWSAKTNDPCQYSEGNLACYCEWNGEYFVVGQNPGALSVGDSCICYECLKYEDKRVAVKIAFKIIERGEVKASIVDTKDVACEFAASEDAYDGTSVEFDIDDVMSKLGVSSPADIQIIGWDADGKVVQEHTSNTAFWYTADGYPGSYGETVAFIEYMGASPETDEDLNHLVIGQMPGSLTAGQTVTMPLGMMANNKIVKLVVNLTVQ